MENDLCHVLPWKRQYRHRIRQAAGPGREAGAVGKLPLRVRAGEVRRAGKPQNGFVGVVLFGGNQPQGRVRVGEGDRFLLARFPLAVGRGFGPLPFGFGQPFARLGAGLLPLGLGLPGLRVQLRLQSVLFRSPCGSLRP